MKQQLLLASLLVILGGTGYEPVLADTTAVPSLTISQLKITSSNGQLVTLYNSSNSTLNMSNYQLEYFNSFDLSKATSSKLIPLSGVLPPHSYFMVNDGTLQLCFQLTVDSTSLGFSSTSGLIEVLAVNQAAPGSLVSAVLQDYVGWSKTAAPGAQILPGNTNAFLQRQPVDSQNNPILTAPGSGSWLPVQPDPANACGLVSGTGATTTSVASGLNQLLPASEPPATIVSAGDVSINSIAALPTADIGLMAPQITELLPNPNGTGNDATDEYIELYNANDVAFDLSGFSLQSGLTTTRSYTFPAGTQLLPHSFTAYYASLTKLTLSNSGGQATFFDPGGNSLSATEPYGNAADGQAWALADGHWYWTLQPTPSSANVVTAAPVKVTKAAAVPKKGVPRTPKVSAAKKVVVAKADKVAKKPKQTALIKNAATTPAPAAAPIHPWILALIASLALLYAVYEYRKDLANQLRILGTNLGGRISCWPKFARRRGDRTGE